MKYCYQIRRYIIIALLIAIWDSAWGLNKRDTIGIGARVLFTRNEGQWERPVLYKAQMHATTLFAERRCFTFVVQHPDNENLRHHPIEHTGNGRYRQHAYRLHFVGSDAKEIRGDGEIAGYENYYVGRDRSRWATGVKTFQGVVYEELYPNIDLRVQTGREGMKYEFEVRRGGNPGKIRMRYEGVDGIRLQDGNLVIRTSVADVVEFRPYCYQTIKGQEVEVVSSFKIDGGIVTIELGEYDHEEELVIDPYLHFSTYTGSTADNWGTTGTYDSYKQTYTAGVVFGVGYPTSLGAYDGSYNGNCDIGIFKFDTSGSNRLFSTYLGGSLADMPHSMYVNSLDELLIFGTTGSSDFPVTQNAFDTTFNGGTSLQYEGSTTINFPRGSDIFISRFSADGTTLRASTYVGGNGNDGLNYRNSFDYSTIMLGNDSLYYNYGDGARGEIITDDLNNVYIGSTTTSTNFPVTPGCVQSTSMGRQEGIVFKIDYNLSNMLWCTYLGGNKDDAIYSIDCDKDYNVIVCGGTNSINFPTTMTAYSRYYNGGSADGFVAKINYHGTTLMSSTYFGSSAYDQCYFVRCGKNNHVFLFGQTKASGNTLIYNATYGTPNSGQFLARFKPDLDTLVWSTVFGTGNGAPNISPTAFAADICNRIYLAGWGRIFCGYYLNGQTMPWNQNGTYGMEVTSDAWQSTTDAQDFYIMSMDANASGLVYATFFGEPHTTGQSGHDHVDGGTSRFDRMATLYQSVCASCGGCDAFPTSSTAWSRHNSSSNCNNAVFRLGLSNDFPVADFLSDTAGCAPHRIQFHNSGRGTSYLWDFGDGTTTTQMNPSHLYTRPGTYTVRLIAYMPSGCTTSDTTSKQVTILGNRSYELDTIYTCPGTPVQIGMRPTLGCSYQWISGVVSDSSVSNPYTSRTGRYGVIISNGTCTDTAWQTVAIGEGSFTVIGDTLTCSVPTQYTITSATPTVRYHWSSERTFGDTLNGDMHSPYFSYRVDSTRWLYIHTEDQSGCEKTDSIHIRYYRVIDSVAVRNPICPNSCSGSARVIVTNRATRPFGYDWGFGWESDSTNIDICAGDYTVRFTDANGCQVEQRYSLSPTLPPTITKNVEHIRCLESCTGKIEIQVNGPSRYMLRWEDNGSADSVRNQLCPGEYIVRITDSSGCVVYDTTQIVENIDINLTIKNIEPTCPGECQGRALAEVQGGTAPYTFRWSNGEEEAQADTLCEGVNVLIMSDAVGCTLIDSVRIEHIQSFDNIAVWADEETIFNGESTQLHVTHIPHASYQWNHPELLSQSHTADPTATPTDTTWFTVTVTDSAGCVYVDSIKINCITVNCGKPNIFIPNAFTPNGDGKNDELCFRGEWIKEFHIALFTRWGEKVYESDDINECWDGRYKDNWCMPGVYVYSCRIVCEGGTETLFKGDVTLIR